MPKIALSQIKSVPGKIKDNADRIVDYIKKAKAKDAEIIVFPELALEGYLHMDLCYSPDFINLSKEQLEVIVKETTNCTVIVGIITSEAQDTGPGNTPILYNSAVVISNEKIIARTNKVLLPNYDVFNEKRYFQSGTASQIFEINNCKIGLLICEDLVGEYYDSTPLTSLCESDPDIIITLNASPFYSGKWEKKLNHIQSIAKKYSKSVFYTNLIGSYDGYDGEIVFDGRSFAVDQNGQLLAQGKEFQEDLLLCEFDNKNSFSPLKPKINSVIEDIHHTLILGIKEFFSRANCKKAVIGLSGGIDSALVATLAVQALGKENVTAITMPSHITGDDTLSDSHTLAKTLGIQIYERPISPEYQAWITEFTRVMQNEPNSMTKQNKQARIRGSILMEFTNEHSGTLLLTTGNKTEIALGYCTLYGDMCGALAPIGDLDKLRVYELSDYINKVNQKEIIPQSTIDRAPTAELEEGQTDEENLPAPYKELVPLVNEIVETDTSKSQLLQKYSKEVVQKTLHLIDINEGKRRQAAPAIRITKGSFGLETRMPMGTSYRAK